jgi:septum formation protein
VSAPELVLASTSAYRRALLDRLGVPYRAVAPLIDERALEPRGVSVEQVVVTLARAKADEVAGRYPGALVLGSDQAIELDGEILGKPGTRARAVEQLARLAGRTHRIVTAVALWRTGGEVKTHVDVHRMTMRRLGRAAIEAYVAADEPLDCAGAYKIESLGVALFEAVEGRDYTAVIGLPLLAVVTMLEEAGVRVLAGGD